MSFYGDRLDLLGFLFPPNPSKKMMIKAILMSTPLKHVVTFSSVAAFTLLTACDGGSSADAFDSESTHEVVEFDRAPEGDGDLILLDVDPLSDPEDDDSVLVPAGLTRLRFEDEDRAERTRQGVGWIFGDIVEVRGVEIQGNQMRFDSMSTAGVAGKDAVLEDVVLTASEAVGETLSGQFSAVLRIVDGREDSLHNVSGRFTFTYKTVANDTNGGGSQPADPKRPVPSSPGAPAPSTPRVR